MSWWAGLIGAALALAAPGAKAACTDTPQPGVDWRRCLLDNRTFIDVDLAGATLREGFFRTLGPHGIRLQCRRRPGAQSSQTPSLVDTLWGRRTPDRH